MLRLRMDVSVACRAGHIGQLEWMGVVEQLQCGSRRRRVCWRPLFQTGGRASVSRLMNLDMDIDGRAILEEQNGRRGNPTGTRTHHVYVVGESVPQHVETREAN